MNSPVAQLVTFVFKVVTVHMRGEWNFAARDYGEELFQITLFSFIFGGIGELQWLFAENLVILLNVS